MSDLDRAKAIFDQALAAPAADREAVVRREAAGDEDLSRLVLGLLRQHDASSEQPTANAETVPISKPATVEGERIGPYKLLSPIGEGGFGTVWLAERREPMVQRVAIKIMKPGMHSQGIIARFEQERQSLAVMDHPNIARVYDGGVTELGLPYFVMEYVQGEPITTFCDRHRYTITQRLSLFITVCEAVQHAHHKGVIHRDIKPSNVLVSMVESQPVAKVIDFGIAKAISHTLTDKTIFTEQGQIIGTPEYMSPEQAEMGRLDIDTRTDVYSLGVLLYELLTGLLPFDPAELRAGGYAEIQRIIREEDPPTPSKRLTSIAGEVRAEIALRRHSERESLVAELRRELEWVPRKAMRKDRQERYRTPADLGDDVRRYLAGEPLQAVPESLAYRARKLVRRNSDVVIVCMCLLSALHPLLWLLVVQRHRIVMLIDRAENALGNSLGGGTEGGLSTGAYVVGFVLAAVLFVIGPVLAVASVALPIWLPVRGRVTSVTWHLFVPSVVLLGGILMVILRRTLASLPDVLDRHLVPGTTAFVALCVSGGVAAWGARRFGGLRALFNTPTSAASAGRVEGQRADSRSRRAFGCVLSFCLCLTLIVMQRNRLIQLFDRIEIEAGQLHQR